MISENESEKSAFMRLYKDFAAFCLNICSTCAIVRLNNVFIRGAGGRALTQSETLRKEVIIMSTYEEFMVLLMPASLIVAILNMKNKK